MDTEFLKVAAIIHRLRRMAVMNQGRYAIHWLHAVCQQTG